MIERRVPVDGPWGPVLPVGLAVVGAIALLHAGPRVGGRLFPAAAFGVALVARAGLATTQHGIDEWWWPFTRPGGRETEYQAAFDLVDRDPLGFIDHFAEQVAGLPVHPSGHPVGATLAARGLQAVGGGVEGYAVLLLVLGAATAWPLYWLGRRLCAEDAARRAVLLWAFAPTTLIYGATSFDAVLVLVATATALALVGGRMVVGGLLAALAFLLSYALALSPLWAALTLARRGGMRAAVAAAIGALAVLAVLAVTLGYDPIGAVRGTHEAYERGIGGTGRPFWYWVVAGPAVFLVGLGPVLAERFLRGVELDIPGARAAAACIVLGALSGVMEAEVERIWQFMIPFAAVAAAPLASRRAVTWAIAVGVAMAYVVELRWDTTF
jgi:hypothetical protein